MNKTYVFSKVAADSIAVAQAVDLQPGESISGVVVGQPTPFDQSLIAIWVSSGNANPLQINISGGFEGMTYGAPITVTTNQRVFTITIAVTCATASFNPHQNQDPNSYQDLVGEIAAGKSALSSVVFQFAPDFDPSGGYVMWDILDSDGVVHATGNAYEYNIRSTGVANVVTARCIISVPASIPPSLDNPYQLRYTLRVGDGVAFNSENIRVYGMSEVQIGTADSIEIKGDKATLSLVTEQVFQNYEIEIYAGNTLLGAMPIGNPERIANGYFVAASIDTSQFPPSLVPYSVMWKFFNNQSQVFRESAALWIVNPSIVQAIEDVKSKINKARQTLFGTPDSQYPSTEVLKWLRRGMDLFNNAYGVFTSFDMTNAMGGVREFWLLCAEKAALEAQYGLEAEKAFNFSGSAISLDVDRTGAIDSMISKIQSQLDQELKPLKQNLIIKGNTSGDGSGPNGNGDFSPASRGAMGSVGIAITPASIYNSGFIFGITGISSRPLA